MDAISGKNEVLESGECRDVGPEKEDKKRKTRNQKEKNRRDQFNVLINELLSLVCQGSERKMDKSLVLRTTINLLKNHKDVKTHVKSNDHCKPAFLSTTEFCQIMLEATDGFIIAINRQGGIVYVSENVLPVLGQEPSVMINRQIFSFIRSAEYFDVNMHLQKQQIHTVDEETQFLQSEDLIEFCCHFLRSSLENNAEEDQYELCKVSGSFKTFDKLLSGGSDECLVAIVRPISPMFYKNVATVDKSNSEFAARVSLQWKFLLLDHRASSIIGYLPFEVLGTCCYDYNHFDDLESLTECHKNLLQYGTTTSGYYRFLTKGQQWIWMKTHYYITYNQWNYQPEFIVCTSTAVSYSEVVKAKRTSASRSHDRIKVADNSDSASEVTRSVAQVRVSAQSDNYGCLVTPERYNSSRHMSYSDASSSSSPHTDYADNSSRE